MNNTGPCDVDAGDGTWSANKRPLDLSSIGTNRIDRFRRVPSDLRKYLEYTENIKAKYGSVMKFVVKERLHWGDGNPEDLKPKGKPFEYNGA